MSEPSEFVIPAPERVTLPVVGTDRLFPVRRVYCVGKNYTAHIREMGADERDPPVFFQKPADSIVEDGRTIPYPVRSDNFHHEIELYVALKSGGYNIPQERALDHVYGYGIALDMTRRNFQADIIAKGMPWEAAKAFDQSCPCGPVHPVEEVGHIDKRPIRLDVNGVRRQESDVELLLWKIPEIIAKLSELYELKAGDIILTGTPHGVGAVVEGDTLVGAIDGLGTLTIRIGPPAA